MFGVTCSVLLKKNMVLVQYCISGQCNHIIWNKDISLKWLHTCVIPTQIATNCTFFRIPAQARNMVKNTPKNRITWLFSRITWISTVKCQWYEYYLSVSKSITSSCFDTDKSSDCAKFVGAVWQSMWRFTSKKKYRKHIINSIVGISWSTPTPMVYLQIRKHM